MKMLGKGMMQAEEFSALSVPAKEFIQKLESFRRKGS